jgi:peptidoglycan/xylan/chitin deacetylase (PgdA/CDA1 family)
MYHSIDEKHKETKLSVSPRDFERQMAFLHSHEYEVVRLEDLVKAKEAGIPIAPQTVAITFDDGYENNYTCAFPVLKRYQFPATIFVATNNIGKPGFLNEQQITEMADSGIISIGSHTLNHVYLPSITDEEQLRREIFESKQRLEELTGQKEIVFSYPVGGFTPRIRQLVREAGYLGACATNPGKNCPNDDIYALKRVRISRTSENMLVFWIESSGYYTFIKEMRDED